MARTRKSEVGYYVSTRRKCESAVSIFKAVTMKCKDSTTVYYAATAAVSIVVEAYVSDKITRVIFMELLEEISYYYEEYRNCKI